MMDDKYVVMKQKDLDALRGDGVELERFKATVKKLALVDAVVIRTRDVFATGGLWAYAHQIQTLLELTRTLSRDLGSGLLVDKVNKLEEVRDYFSDRAQEAERRMVMGQAKLPD